jgi:predicted phosphodiesterase
MRIAVLADIHGNRLALNAVLTDLERRGGAEQILNLGDCVSGPLWPGETMERLATLDALTVRGNHDRQVAMLPPDEMIASDRFAFNALTLEQRGWLGALPMTATIVPGVLACHATPKYDNVYLLDSVRDGRLVRDRDEAVMERLGGVSATKIVLCGHSHRPDIMLLQSSVLTVNPGSVGCPAYDDLSDPTHVSEAGSNHARYALLDFTAADGDGGDQANVTFVAVPFTSQEAARRAELNDWPDWACQRSGERVFR